MIRDGTIYLTTESAVMIPDGALVESIDWIALNNADSAAFTMTVIDTTDGGFNRLEGVWRASGTVISYRLDAASAVDVTVYDVRGRLVALLDRSTQPAGEHTLVWDGRNDRGHAVASGVYFVRLRTDIAVTHAKIAKQR